MADFYMHCRLVTEFYSHVQSGTDFAKIGAQGPDYFYYVLSKSDKQKASKAGNYLHQQKTKGFLEALLNQAIKTQSLGLYDYVLGFLSHHALDVAIHPYIFYYTGVYQEHDPKTAEYAGLHLQFERKVDIAFIIHQFGFKPHTRKLGRNILPSKKMPDEIAQAIEEAVAEVYELKGTGVLFQKGYQIMRKVEHHLVRDRTGMKRALLKYVTPYRTPRALYYQDLSHRQNISDFDYLNLEQSTWLHPVLGTPHAATVLDLYDQAKALLNEWVPALKKAYDQKDASILSSILPNASYETGLPLHQSQRMHYFKNYRHHLKK